MEARGSVIVDQMQHVGGPSLRVDVVNLGVARQLAPLFPHPGFQNGDQRRTALSPHGLALLGWPTVDGALDLEQGIDALHGLKGDRRDHSRSAALRLAASRCRPIGELEVARAGTTRLLKSVRLSDHLRARHLFKE
jgi:hypothetical protein